MSDDKLLRQLDETLGSISAPEVFHGDNLAIVLCTVFEDDGEQNENGWTDAAIEGCEQTLQAIRLHYRPLHVRIREQRDLLDECETLIGAMRQEIQNLGGSLEGVTAADATLAKLRGQDRG